LYGKKTEGGKAKIKKATKKGEENIGGPGDTQHVQLRRRSFSNTPQTKRRWKRGATRDMVEISGKEGEQRKGDK